MEEVARGRPYAATVLVGNAVGCVPTERAEVRWGIGCVKAGAHARIPMEPGIMGQRAGHRDVSRETQTAEGHSQRSAAADLSTCVVRHIAAKSRPRHSEMGGVWTM